MARNQASRVLLLGTNEREANRIVAALKIQQDMSASVERFMVDDKPTEWWHVYVPRRDEQVARAWLRGLQFGQVCECVDRNSGNAVMWPEYAAIFASEAR